MSFSELLDRRKSIRAFSPESIDIKKIESIISAAGSSASAYNEQPWRFIIVHKKSLNYQKALNCLTQWNQTWAKTAPVLVIGITKSNFSHNGAINFHSNYDLGQAVAYLSMQATNEGLFVHQMAGFDVQNTKELFLIPDGFEPIVFIAVGFAGEIDILPPELQLYEKKKRERKPISEIAMDGAWGMNFHP